MLRAIRKPVVVVYVVESPVSCSLARVGARNTGARQGLSGQLAS